MKKFLFLVGILGLTLTQAFADTSIYKSGNYYGLKDSSGKVLAKPIYQEIKQLSYKPQKRVLIPMHTMDEVSEKTLDYYKVKKNNLYGVMNSNGGLSCECEYSDVEVSDNGEIRLKTNDGYKYLHPLKNASKVTKDTMMTVVGIPVTILGTAMMPIEALSKIGRDK
jgi:hypothetical protein